MGGNLAQLRIRGALELQGVLRAWTRNGPVQLRNRFPYRIDGFLSRGDPSCSDTQTITVSITDHVSFNKWRALREPKPTERPWLRFLLRAEDDVADDHEQWRNSVRQFGTYQSWRKQVALQPPSLDEWNELDEETKQIWQTGILPNSRAALGNAENPLLIEEADEEEDAELPDAPQPSQDQVIIDLTSPPPPSSTPPPPSSTPPPPSPPPAPHPRPVVDLTGSLSPREEDQDRKLKKEVSKREWLRDEEEAFAPPSTPKRRGAAFAPPSTSEGKSVKKEPAPLNWEEEEDLEEVVVVPRTPSRKGKKKGAEPPSSFTMKGALPVGSSSSWSKEDQRAWEKKLAEDDQEQVFDWLKEAPEELPYSPQAKERAQSRGPDGSQFVISGSVRKTRK